MTTTVAQVRPIVFSYINQIEPLGAFGSHNQVAKAKKYPFVRLYCKAFQGANSLFTCVFLNALNSQSGSSAGYSRKMAEQITHNSTPTLPF